MTEQLKLDKLYSKAYDFLLLYGPRFLIGMIVLFVGFWLIKTMLNWSQRKMHHKQVDPTIKPFLISLIGVALRIMLILSVMQIIGIQMTLFNVLIGGLSVAAGLALAGNLQNFASGIVILLLKPFIVGDNINTQGMEGTVTAIQIFYTIVTTFDNRTLIVPNSQLSNQVIINTSREGNRRLDINYKIPNNVDIKQAKEIIAKTLDNSEECLISPQKRIGVGELLPDGYVLSISVWVNAHGFQDTKLLVQEKILQDIKDAGIKIPGM
ncbi:mechanosensitive ion channel family protein [Mucilaginibacter panaciglaebae]|uniref:Mechanosensitive ion channel n=1 Tax=Mucilaginibacter panaciglaebae TaxID=502331 RepID=A0ABP7WTE3_9SPHI